MTVSIPSAAVIVPNKIEITYDNPFSCFIFTMNYLAHLSRHFSFLEHFPASNRISQAIKLYNEKKYRNVTLVRERHPEADNPYRANHKWISIKNDEGHEIDLTEYEYF